MNTVKKISAVMAADNPPLDRFRHPFVWTAILLSVFTSQFAYAADQLTLADKADLTHHLNVIATDMTWVPASIDSANAIINKPEYNEHAWESFFTEYFTAKPYTDGLESYLGYPVFWWFDETVHLKLQKGLIRPLIDVNVVPDWNTAIAGGGTTFASDPLLSQTVYNSQRVLTWMGKQDTLSTFPAETLSIYNNLIDLVNVHPTVLRNSAMLDRTSQPHFGALRTQAHMAMLANAPSSERTRAVFTPAVKTEIAATLGLTGKHAEIWNDFTLLLCDNNMASDLQKQTIYQYLSLVPQELHNLATITINKFLGNSEDYQDRNYDFLSRYGVVNIFETLIGVVIENSFPSDVEPGMVDGFTITVAHESNHVVDDVAVKGNPTLAARRQALLDAAGYDSQNFLRSDSGDGFFQDSPVEFIASIANQWFTDSCKTIELGLVRFDAGREDPINQALFFAEIYSQGGGSTFFYKINTSGQILREEIPVGRSIEGFIDDLIFDGNRYMFDLDSEGNVTGYTIVPVVTGRHIFYNNSAFDGNNPAATAGDDAAIATDKSALLPGETASFTNYTSYSRSINGIMVDIATLTATPTAADFEFKVGNSNDPSTWATAPAPTSITIREDAGASGTDRVTIIWADNAIQNQWLEVTVKATISTGLSAADVFYFGNAIGETGNSITDAKVTPTDTIVVRNNPHSATVNPAGIDDNCDFNRDKKVGPTDSIICRNNGTNSSTALQLITVP